MTKNQIYILASIAIIVIVYFVFFNKKKAESAWKPEFRDVNKDIRTMEGKGNYENVVGMKGKGF